MPTKPHKLSSLPHSEWFVPFHVEDVPTAGRTIQMQAETDHLAGIAKRLDVRRVDSVKATLNLSLQNAGHILYINGTFTANIVQDCVVTLEPIESVIEDSFEAWYADHDKAVSFTRAKHKVQTIEDGDEVQILEEKDDPESLIDGQVDLGEVVIQFLSLSINPFPRKDGVEDVVIVTPEKSSASSLRPNPFSALKNWRPKD